MKMSKLAIMVGGALALAAPALAEEPKTTETNKEQQPPPGMDQTKSKYGEGLKKGQKATDEDKKGKDTTGTPPAQEKKPNN